MRVCHSCNFHQHECTFEKPLITYHYKRYVGVFPALGQVTDLEHLDALHLTRLEDELRVLKELQYSPHVAQLQDAFRCQGHLYIVMVIVARTTHLEITYTFIRFTLVYLFRILFL